jgi:Holliday junction resolvasome RuvABC DNA-binding subunit
LPVEEDVISALVNLGYNRPVVEKAVSRLGNSAGQTFDALFRSALAALAK